MSQKDHKKEIEFLVIVFGLENTGRKDMGMERMQTRPIVALVPIILGCTGSSIECRYYHSTRAIGDKPTNTLDVAYYIYR